MESNYRIRSRITLISYEPSIVVLAIIICGCCNNAILGYRRFSRNKSFAYLSVVNFANDNEAIPKYKQSCSVNEADRFSFVDCPLFSSFSPLSSLPSSSFKLVTIQVADVDVIGKPNVSFSTELAATCSVGT
ncbi:hypothetical protein DERF_012738 [Dermatophagoides farinae]|uniref:Uncharacterized protein n=1 Tax=Dermatophagoides farinae TaxID=6954 RepID=A0A922HT72_DERFA|nr:hypothetical protein DERF_012738 [Dermatophagoides farinae]